MGQDNEVKFEIIQPIAWVNSKWENMFIKVLLNA